MPLSITILFVSNLYNVQVVQHNPISTILVRIESMFICKLNLNISWACLGFQGISDTRPDGELATNVAKAYACAENDTGNPSAHCHALLGDASPHYILPPSSIQESSANCWPGRGGNKLGFHSQDPAHANQANGACEEEAGGSAVDQVPEDGVCEREGERGLRGRLPGESTLENTRR